MIKSTILLSLIISSLLLQTRADTCSTTWTVHTTNNLPPNSPPPAVHCRLKDDDLGNRTLAINADYNFSFCLDPISTQCSCNFQWNNKVAALDIYTPPFGGTCTGPEVCFYEVRIDGLYYSKSYPPVQLQKVVSWDSNA
ncbi:hypothetical protein ACS0TY_009407 [Phlomoides rotata]